MSLKKTVGLLLGPALFGGLVLWPMPSMPREAHLLLGVYAWIVAYGVTEVIPVPATALTASVLSVLLGIAPSQAVLAPYADPIIFLFIGSFIPAFDSW